jgi:hypothetical protein
LPFIRSHWVWFFAFLTITSGLDYWDRISLPGSAFAQAPGAWFAFTAAAHLSFCVIAYGAACGARRAIGPDRVPVLVPDTLGVGAAIAAHLMLTAPFWDRVFWQGTRTVDAVLVTVLVSCGLYVFYRVLFGYISHLRLHPPTSLP